MKQTLLLAVLVLLVHATRLKNTLHQIEDSPLSLDYKQQSLDQLVAQQRGRLTTEDSSSFSQSVETYLDQQNIYSSSTEPLPEQMANKFTQIEHKIERNVFRFVHSPRQEQRLRESAMFHRLTFMTAVLMVVLMVLVMVGLVGVLLNMMAKGIHSLLYYNRMSAHQNVS